jgi:hypothetical protein
VAERYGERRVVVLTYIGRVVERVEAQEEHTSASYLFAKNLLPANSSRPHMDDTLPRASFGHGLGHHIDLMGRVVAARKVGMFVLELRGTSFKLLKVGVLEDELWVKAFLVRRQNWCVYSVGGGRHVGYVLVVVVSEVVAGSDRFELRCAQGSRSGVGAGDDVAGEEGGGGGSGFGDFHESG